MADEYDGWQRVGGRNFQFYATDEEIAEWLIETLPTQFVPYSVLGREWRDSRWRFFDYPLADVRACMSHHRRSNLWIRSHAPTPSVSAASDERELSLGGLILVQLGRQLTDGKLDEARLAVVDRIRHAASGREHRHRDYKRIFDRLKRAMQKRLVVTTQIALPDGTATDGWPMTARAAEEHVRDTVRFTAEPTGLRG
jgi:hypothetical protein